MKSNRKSIKVLLKHLGKDKPPEIDPEKIEDFQEKADELGVPLILPFTEHEKNNKFESNPIISICGECGLTIRRIMYYCCNNTYCPCGLNNKYYYENGFQPLRSAPKNFKIPQCKSAVVKNN